MGNSNSCLLTPALHCPVAHAQEEDQGNHCLLQPQETQGHTHQETDRLCGSSLLKSTLNLFTFNMFWVELYNTIYTECAPSFLNFDGGSLSRQEGQI